MKSKEIKENQSNNLAVIRKRAAYRKALAAAKAKVKLAIVIAEARKEKGWSQQKLAAEAATTQKVVSKIESAEMNVGFDLLQRLALSLGLDLQVGDTVFAGEQAALTQINIHSHFPLAEIINNVENKNISTLPITKTQSFVITNYQS